jgi:hypothetical protein
MPTTRPRGTHVFRPSATTTPSFSDDINETEGEGSLATGTQLLQTTSGGSGEGSSTMAEDCMVIDTPPVQSGQPSISASKRKFLSLSDPDETGSVSSSDPSKKHSKNSKGSKGSKHKIPIASQRLAAQISQAASLNNMQGTVNRLADVFEKSMGAPEEGSVIRRDRAMQLVQDVEDGLSVKEKAVLITHFMNNAIAADTYLSLKDNEVRKAWVSSMLASD